MRQVLSTVIAIALLVSLGALAVLALPGARTALAPANVAAAPVAFQGAAAPEAVTGTQNYNVIGMPLDATDQFTNQGLGFDSDGLADLVGPSVLQVLRWNSGRQEFDSWDPVNNDGTVDGIYTTSPFPLTVGGSYWLLIDSTGPTVVSFVGDVPAMNSVKFTLVGTSPACSYNAITIPLEQSSLTDADLLADSISTTEVAQVLRWNANRQEFDLWDPINGDGTVDGQYTTTPFTTRIGYPYWVCLYTNVNGNIWP